MKSVHLYSSCPFATLFLQDLAPSVVGGREKGNREEQMPLYITAAITPFFLLAFSASLV